MFIRLMVLSLKGFAIGREIKPISTYLNIDTVVMTYD